MDHSLPLRRFEYCIPNPGSNDMEISDIHSLEMNMPRVNVDIDFEKRNLSLEGDSWLILDDSQNPEPAHYAGNERIKVRATIYKGFSISLANLADDELVYSLEGILEDGKSITSCSGLMVLNGAAGGKEQCGRKWYLAVYLYDDYDDERAIRLKLAIHSFAENAELN